MKISRIIAICALLISGCTATRHATLVDCSPEYAMTRGEKDGASGHKAKLGFLRVCTAETRPAALASYREGFAAARAKRKVERKAEKEEPVIEEEEDDSLPEVGELPGPGTTPIVLPAPIREPSAVSWVCEVEASSRVFTGVGVTRDEALGSARASCGSHFQASYCTKADCKQNM